MYVLICFVPVNIYNDLKDWEFLIQKKKKNLGQSCFIDINSKA